MQLQCAWACCYAGVLLNVLFPDWLLTFLLTALLLYLTLRIAHKAHRLFKVRPIAAAVPRVMNCVLIFLLSGLHHAP